MNHKVFIYNGFCPVCKEWIRDAVTKGDKLKPHGKPRCKGKVASAVQGVGRNWKR